MISHQKRGASAANASDMRTLSRYFEDAADLVEDRAYQLTQETIARDAEWAIEF